MAPATALPSRPTPTPANGKERGSRPAVVVGDINLTNFYHKGAVIANEAGSHAIVVESWGELAGHEPPYGAKVQRCSPAGEPMQNAVVGVLSHVPKTALSVDQPEITSPWAKTTTLVVSKNPKLPSGLNSSDPSLLLVPYGPFFGKELGLLNDEQRKSLAATARRENFKKAVCAAKPFPGANKPQRVRLSEESMRQLLSEQGEVIRGIPLVNAIEEFCGYAPDDVKGPVRKYRVGDQILNLNTAKNSFGSLNDHKFHSLSKERGSSNNAMDIVAAVREMEGTSADFRTIRQGLIRHFNLQPKLDLMFADAVRRENARLSGETLAPAPVPAFTADTVLKEPVEKKPVEEAEVPFDLQTGMPVGSKEMDRGGGFCERPDLWPAARRFLVEERKLDSKLVDHLYEARNLYAARRQFPANPKFPYKSNFQDVIVAPVFGFNSGEVVGVDTKPLPRKPGEKTEGRNHGKTGQGAFMFGTWGEETKRVVLTEGFIKGIAWFQLHREQMQIGPETCVMSRSGAKPTLEIIPRLKALGAEAIVAYDNDFTGRQKSKAFYDECLKQGVPCREMFVEPSEVTAVISHEKVEGLNDSERAKQTAASIVEFAESQGLPWAYDKALERTDITAIRLPNTAAVINHLEEHLKADRALGNRDYQSRAKGLSEFQQQKLEKRRWLKVEIHHKDWDDIVRKGALRPELCTELPGVIAQPEARATPPSQWESAGAGQDLKRGFLVSRPEKSGQVARQIFSVGTLDAIYDLQLDHAAETALAQITSAEAPSPAVIAQGPEIRLVALGDNSGNPLDLSPLGPKPITLHPSPAAVLHSWHNPSKPVMIESLVRLRRVAGLPTPMPSPVIEPERD